MHELVVANRYASALFELVGPMGFGQAVEAELLSFSAALKAEPGLEKFFRNPSVRLEDKTRTLEGLYAKDFGKAQEVLVRFLGVLVKKGRFHLIHDVAALYKKIADEAQKRATLYIRTAIPLSPQAERSIVSRMEKMVDARLEVRKELDASIIGGVVLRFRNKILDGSVRNKIQLFRKELAKVQTV